MFVYTFGDEQTHDTFTAKFGPNTEGTDAGHFTGGHLSGDYTFTGTEGNCVTAPITRGDVRMVNATLTL